MIPWAHSLRERKKIDYAALHSGQDDGEELETKWSSESEHDSKKDSDHEVEDAIMSIQGVDELVRLIQDEEAIQEELIKKEKVIMDRKNRQDLAEKLNQLKQTNLERKQKLATLDKSCGRKEANRTVKSNKVSIKDLRSFENMASDVEKQLAKMGLTERKETWSEDTSSSQEYEDDEEKKTEYSSRKTRGKKKRSGKNAKVTSRVINPQIWPQSELSLSHIGKEVRFEDLTIEEFVAGYSAILILKSISKSEREYRVEHLNSLMYLATVYEWTAVKNFHATVLLEIERGYLQWGQSFLHLEHRTLLGAKKKLHDSKPTDQKRNASHGSNSSVVLFCRDFQRGSCLRIRIISAL